MILRSRLNQVKIHSQKLQREYLESKKLLTRTLTIIIQDEQELKVSSILLNMTDISLNWTHITWFKTHQTQLSYLNQDLNLET